jgi:hypothetical protein
MTQELLKIDSLDAGMIGGIYGRTNSLTSRILPKQPAKVRIVCLSVPFLVLLFVLAHFSRVLTGPDHILAAFGFHVEIARRPTIVSLPLLFDPVAIIAMVAFLATPVCCAEQVASISLINPMILSNITYRHGTLDPTIINCIVGKANRSFSFIGLRSTSIAIFLASFIESLALYKYIEHHGILSSWNPTSLSDARWRRVVYAGWWANAHSHTVLAIFLVMMGTYYIYHLTKELALGIVFALYGRRALKASFGAAPNLSLNADGYHGFRRLRYFMQWTYFTTVLGYVLTLGLFVVWLPFNRIAAVIVGVVIVMNCATVLYPTSLVCSGVLVEKTNFVDHISSLGHSHRDTNEIIEKAWGVPSLPFKIRGTVFAVTLYLVIPVFLVYVASILK